MSHIKYKNRTTEEFGLIMSNAITFNSPSLDYEAVKVKGLDGEIIKDGVSLNNVTRSFPFNLVTYDKTVTQRTQEIVDWLRSDISWSDLTFADDPEHVYSAIYTEELDIERTLKTYGKCVLNFTLKPVKYLVSSTTSVDNPTSLNNPTNQNAKPTIRVEGTGDITVKIGKESLVLKGVDGGVIVNSRNQTVTSLDGTRSQTSKMYSYPFPVIAPGTNVVATSGTVTKLSITPFYERVV